MIALILPFRDPDEGARTQRKQIFAVLSFKSSDGKVASRDRLEVVDKCIVDGSASERADDRDGLRGSLLGNDEPEPRGDLSDQAHEHWAAFSNDATLSDEASGFRNGLRQDSATTK